MRLEAVGRGAACEKINFCYKMDAEHDARAKRLFEALPSNIITVIVATNKTSVESHDMDFPFRPNSNMLYMCGCKEPDCALVISRQADKIERSVLDYTALAAQVSRIQWDSTAMSYDERTFDSASDRVHGLLERYRSRCRSCVEDIHRLRLTKSAVELDKIRRACHATAVAMAAAESACSAGESEKTVAARFRLALYKSGVDCCAFPTIVAFDANALHLHHIPTHKSGGQRFLIDAGGMVDFYAADMTRSWQTSRNALYTSMHAVVSSAHRAAVAACTPEQTHEDVEKAARDVLKKGCADLGIVMNCPHYISHWVGLDVHDVGDRDVEFDVGMVLAVEPGLYLDEQGIGIRIEDTVRVDERPEILTSYATESDSDPHGAKPDGARAAHRARPNAAALTDRLLSLVGDRRM